MQAEAESRTHYLKIPKDDVLSFRISLLQSCALPIELGRRHQKPAGSGDIMKFSLVRIFFEIKAGPGGYAVKRAHPPRQYEAKARGRRKASAAIASKSASLSAFFPAKPQTQGRAWGRTPCVLPFLCFALLCKIR